MHRTQIAQSVEEMGFEENPIGGLIAVVNPSRRKRRTKKGHRRSARRMTAKQLKYFGPRRGRARKARKARRARTITIRANPARRRSKRRSARRSARRSFRRNPIGAAQMRASLGTVQRAVVNAATGAAGAIAVDVAMGQASRFLPVSMVSRFNAEGGINFPYYGVKAALAIALGIAGSRFLPGKLKGMAARGAEGALTVQAYELGRALLPAEITLGYMTPGRMAGMGKYLNRNNVRAYLPTGRVAGLPGFNETRVGEGSVQ